MIDIIQQLTRELSLKTSQVENALQLRREGGTVPFIARYRKERTGEMDEVQLHSLFERHTYLTQLEDRKRFVLEAIARQDKLTDDLRARIEACIQKTELEDLYLPYRPKKRTRAAVARERGLEPFVATIKTWNDPSISGVSLQEEAARYISAERGVSSVEEALAGASDILAEEVAEQADHRAFARGHLMEHASFVSTVKAEFPEGSTKFEMYRSFKALAKEIHPHNMLALLRGEKEGIVELEVQGDDPPILAYLLSREVRAGDEGVRAFLTGMVQDAFERLLKPSLITEVRAACKERADRESTATFEQNLRELLLSPPAGMKPTIGLDPGFRTGCKLAVLDGTGKLVEHHTIRPHQSDAERQAAGEVLARLIREHHIELIAIGNGTASRETEQFVAGVLASLEEKPLQVIVNESGASIYSASKVAREEFPELDVTVRGAISIGRRLQDPLAELVKIDPKSIGVGQYQHDVEQKLLRRRLNETVESCVNFVGVDVNLASRELLRYVAGVNAQVADNIVTHRNANGPFSNREQLKGIPKFGPKSFEQAAGFLRIRGGDNPLDNSAVHPEAYPVAEKILADLGMSLEQVVQTPDRVRSLELARYITDVFGEPTLRDILAELQKPGRDPRAEFRYAHFKEGVKEIKDLLPGMELEGVVTNVTNFGAFVDIGVHQDGLVHVSQMADRFVEDPKRVVKVGMIVNVRVLEVNEQLKRISLTMKSPDAGRTKHDHRHGKKQKRPEGAESGKPGTPKSGGGEKQKGQRAEGRQKHPKDLKKTPPAPATEEPAGRYTLEDLRAKFNNR